jgi:putative peptide zinc metalloprotease protein
MNLSEAFDATLPELPKARLGAIRPPRVDPTLIVREDILDGEPVVGVLQRNSSNFFRFPAAQWQLIQLFDGVRSYEEIADLHRAETGIALAPDDVQIFAEEMDALDFWFKTPQEKNLALNERLMAQRSRRSQRKSKLNLAHISFSAWDPDRYLGWLDSWVGKIIYNPWSVFAVIALFVFEFAVFVTHWSVIGPDILVYYSFKGKAFSDIAEFWILLLVIGFVHETAHGLTCKHFGGEVHAMGLMFLYLAPAFYVDVTETWVSATRVQRLWTIIAGIWIELVICGVAMLIWTNTFPGFWLHDLTYKVILITGVAVIVMNLNPLLKLDGYYFLTEAIGVPDLKEKSTAFVSEWIQVRIFRLPGVISPIPRRRAPFFVLYALVSGAYSYLVLFAVLRFVFNVTTTFLAEFAIVPVAFMAFMMFRSRLRALRSFAIKAASGWKLKQRLLRPTSLAVFAAIALLLFVPFWRDREDAWFVVESNAPLTIHSAIAGRVTAVMVRAGQHVKAGEPLLRMTSLDQASMQSASLALTRDAQYRSFESELRGQSIGDAAAQADAARQTRDVAAEAKTSLTLAAPTDGVILDQDPDALLDNIVGSGQSLLSLAGGSHRIARVYIMVSSLDRIAPASHVLLLPPGGFRTRTLPLAGIDSSPLPLPQDLIARSQYKGIEVPTFYTSRIPLSESDSELPLGSAGHAKVLGQYHSIFYRGARAFLELFGRHVW